MYIDPGTFMDNVKCQAVNNDISRVLWVPYELGGNPCKIVGQGSGK